jgi:hypothetical protein
MAVLGSFRAPVQPSPRPLAGTIGSRHSIHATINSMAPWQPGSDGATCDATMRTRRRKRARSHPAWRLPSPRPSSMKRDPGPNRPGCPSTALPKRGSLVRRRGLADHSVIFPEFRNTGARSSIGAGSPTLRGDATRLAGRRKEGWALPTEGKLPRRRIWRLLAQRSGDRKVSRLVLEGVKRRVFTEDDIASDLQASMPSYLQPQLRRDLLALRPASSRRDLDHKHSLYHKEGSPAGRPGGREGRGGRRVWRRRQW